MDQLFALALKNAESSTDQHHTGGGEQGSSG